MTHVDSHAANHRFCTLLPLVTPPAGGLPLLRPERSVVGSPQWDLFKTAQRKYLRLECCFRTPWVWLSFEGVTAGLATGSCGRYVRSRAVRRPVMVSTWMR